MRRLTLALAIGVALLGSVAVGGAPAAYAADGGLAVTVRATDPLAPVVTLTNRGAEACQAAATPLGTITIAALAQGGRASVPTTFSPGLDEPLETVVGKRLRTLQPGESLDLRLQLLPIGTTGHSIEIVTYTGTVAPMGLLYPVQAGQPLDLRVSYYWRIAPAQGPPLCTASAPSTVVGAAASAPTAAVGSGRLWLIGGVVLIVLINVVVVVVLLLRRRRRAAAAAVLILLAALSVPVAQARPAHARVVINNPSLQAPYDACLATLQQPGHDPAGILDTILGPGVTVTLEVPTDGVTHEGGLSRSEMFIFWNADDRSPYFGGGGNADPCTSLYHEMFHAWEDSQGIQDHHECITADGRHTGIGINEVHATEAQNPLRVALGMPPRDHYGSNPLPTSPCRPSQETDPVCTDQGCPASDGEPHLTTVDGKRYDFQAAGEFVAARDPAGGFTVQVRQQPFRDSLTLAVNTSVALDVAGDRVQVDLATPGISVLVGGTPRDGALTELEHGGQVRIGDGGAGRLATVIWPDGSAAWVTGIAGLGLNLSIQPAPARKAKLEGLLGSGPRVRGGATITGDDYDTLYPAFADSWRIDDAASLFTYPAGRTTASYTDRAFPHRAETGAPVDTAAAEAICAKAGVTAAAQLADCVFDVSRTGQPAFAASALAAQAFASGAVPGAAITVPANADVYLAGAAPLGMLPGGAGTLPVRIAFDAAKDRRISFPSITGVLGAAGSDPKDGADGGVDYGGTSVTALNGISGVIHQKRSLFLVGVFLPAGAPTGSGQPDVTDQEGKAEVAPALGVLFAIGDGKTAAGAVQQFAVPSGATRLYIGFADSVSFHGSPGYYGDNTGFLAVTFAVG
ncbi:hypothetical protein F4553_006940 [Allocatelliglobosispora scoriae]|uniref:VWFD domain-containing protein n=1 Tax=Allocatelliglobosispora scoriae TaxID=643052 RepID=A0A841C0X1_9ACTN|nr:hypothetical protein [Allocatelliglobosispora scoriae]MBB5873506.1 hypothetical protein [Allocatelliglobosispora scoriae]